MEKFINMRSIELKGIIVNFFIEVFSGIQNHKELKSLKLNHYTKFTELYAKPLLTLLQNSQKLQILEIEDFLNEMDLSDIYSTIPYTLTTLKLPMKITSQPT